MAPRGVPADHLLGLLSIHHHYKVVSSVYLIKVITRYHIFVNLQLILVSNSEDLKDPFYQNVEGSHSSSDEELDDVSISRSLFNEPSTSKEINACSLKKGRKRISDEGKWKKNIAKCLRNSGQSYESSRTKTKMNPRQMKPPCTEKCIMKCFTKIMEDDRRQIFLSYWNLGDLQKQRYFISSCLTVQPKYRYVREGSHRSMNSAFFFHLREKNIRVCKIFFKNTLDISDRSIATVIAKKDKFSNVLEADRRGKHGNHSKKYSKV